MIRKLYAGKSWFAVGLAVISVTMIAALGGCVAQEQESAEEVQVQKADQLSEEPEAVSEPEMDATPKSDAGSESSADADASVKASVEDYTWEELSQISNEIAQTADEDEAIEVAKRYNLCTPDGKLDGTQVKSVTLSDGTQTTVQIVGFAHDDKTAGGKAGITFIFGDCIAEAPMNGDGTNAGGWEGSQMRASLNGEGLNLLPRDLASVIVSVDKLTNNVGETDSVSSVSATSDKLWLFSATELCGAIDWWGSNDYAAAIDVLNAEGSEYKLFCDTSPDSATSPDASGNYNVLIRNFDDAPDVWWERSASPLNPNGFCQVSTWGDPDYAATGAYDADLPLGVVPGFCI